RADEDRAVRLLGDAAGLDRDAASTDGDVTCVHVDLLLSSLRQLPDECARLFADAEPLDQFRIAVGVLPLQVIEEATALADQLQEPAARMVVLCVRLEMFGEIADALAEERNLHFGGSSVAGMGRVAANDFGLTVLAKHGMSFHVRSRNLGAICSAP